MQLHSRNPHPTPQANTPVAALLLRCLLLQRQGHTEKNDEILSGFISAFDPLRWFSSQETFASVFNHNKSITISWLAGKQNAEQKKEKNRSVWGLFGELKRTIATDACIWETVRHTLVRLPHLICAADPWSAMFSPLSPPHIATAEDESPFSSPLPPLSCRHSLCSSQKKKCANTTEKMSNHQTDSQSMESETEE